MRTSELYVRVNRFLPRTRVEGPGERACIWVQGCSIQCPGCAVPWTWPREGGRDYAVEELAGTIIGERGIEGVTFMGGEPFDQAEALGALGEKIREAGLSVVTFSGYEFDEISVSTEPDWRRLANATDLLIAGPYIRERASLSNPWVGSSNQTYHFLTPRYRSLEGRLGELGNGIEIRVRPGGEVFINGMADVAKLRDIAACVATPAAAGASSVHEGPATVSETVEL